MKKENKTNWRLDVNRSIGSPAYDIFGALLCDGCSQQSDKLYGGELKNGEFSEDIYCKDCCKQMDNEERE